MIVEINDEQLGELVKAMRLRKGISQGDLADSVDLARTSITNIESGKQKVMLKTLAAIAEKCDYELTIVVRRKGSESMVDRLLNHCDKDGGECGVCGSIVCPFEDAMHFHHDGCPSCTVLNR